MEETLTGERNLAGELLRIVPRSLLYTHALLPHKRGMLSILSPPYTNPDLSSLAGGDKAKQKTTKQPHPNNKNLKTTNSYAFQNSVLPKK